MPELSWYVRRLQAMTPSEVLGRVQDSVEQRRLRGTDGVPDHVAVVPRPGDGAGLGAVPPAAQERLVVTADRLLAGEWTALGQQRSDLAPTPDWFLDPVSGSRAPQDDIAFDIDHRDAARVGDAKQVWELSRHHHLTLLAAAYATTGHEKYATMVDTHLRSWWAENPFITGVHWTSGIELGMRLIAWAWTHRLLEQWPGRSELFEKNEAFVRQLYGHQLYLDRLRSRGSSANNHLIAEEAGLFVAAIAFPYFSESAGWAEDAFSGLVDALAAQTYPSGLNRELATDYHGYVLELALLAATEADAAGRQPSSQLWDLIAAMADALASMVDCRLRPPRQGDSDDAVALLVDGDPFDRWNSLLVTCAELLGAPEWWPRLNPPDVRATLLAEVAARHPRPSRQASRRLHDEDAGMTILVGDPHTDGEIWLRLEGGPLGYLKTAAHGHADALAVELRIGGVDVLSDPGTYVYQGDAGWREHFRATKSHSTIEVEGESQAVSVGPFLWRRHPSVTVSTVTGLHGESLGRWRGSHDGYRRLAAHTVHTREVTLDRSARAIDIVDTLDGDGPVTARVTYQLGPEISCRIEGDTAALTWDDKRVVATLPTGLAWRVEQGGTDPIEGWYSPSFGTKMAAAVMIGVGTVVPGATLHTRFRVGEVDDVTDPQAYESASSGGPR